MATTDIVIFFALLLGSAFFSGSESALTAVNAVRVQTLVKSGDRTAVILQRILEDRSRLISALLIGNNIVNVALTAFATIVFSQAFSSLPEGLAPFIGGSVTIVFLLVIGEVIPKTIGVNLSLKFSLAVAWPIYFVRQFLTPFTLLLSGMQTVVLKLMRHDPDKEQLVTGADIKTMVRLADDQDQLGEGAPDAIERLVHLHEMKIREVMTPRIDIVGISVHKNYTEVLEALRTYQYSRIPIYDKDIDDVLGVLTMRDILAVEDKDREHFSLKKLMRPAVFVPEQKRIDEMILEMKRKKIHLAIVVDEYGGVAGLVTLEDLLEEVVGQIEDEFDREGPNVRHISPNLAVLDASCSLLDLENTFHTKIPGVEGIGNIAGLFLREFKDIPVEGDRVIYGFLEFIINRMRGKRITRIMVRRLQKNP